MYDWELNCYLASKGYSISHTDYLYVCAECPQLKSIKYNPFDDCFEAWSDDGNCFRFKVYYAGRSQY